MSVTVEPELPVHVDLNAYQGDTWSQTFRLLRGATPVDVSDGKLSAACRSNGGELYAMSATPGSNAGEVVLTFVTPPSPADYAYDLEHAASDGAVTTWVQGRLRISRAVTP